MAAETPNTTGAFGYLNRIERIGLVALLLGVIIFGVVTEVRSAFLKRRMTDVDTYFRAAWAVRVHKDPYNVTDTNGWHYNYPPLLAVALWPLADAPAGHSRAGLLPYAVSVGIWYVISIVVIWLGVCFIAHAFEASSSDPMVRSQKRYCRRWWALRILPILVCMPALGRALARGQINCVLLMLFCLAGAALTWRKQIAAGFWLGLTAAIKVFPAFLLLYAFWRMRFRMLVGAATALLLGVIVIPALVMGPHHAYTAESRFMQVVIEPALGLNHNTSRDRELLDVNKTDSNSFEAMIDHTVNIGHPAPPPAPWMKIAHWSISALCVLITLWVEFKTRQHHPLHRNLFLGALITIMMPIVPICHPHYYCMVLPLVTTMLAVRWEKDQKLPIGWGLGLVLLFFAASHVLTVLPPPFYILRGLGLVTYAALVLWAAALVMMWKLPRWVPVAATTPADAAG